jgi:hypothetical protein
MHRWHGMLTQSFDCIEVYEKMRFHWPVKLFFQNEIIEIQHYLMFTIQWQRSWKMCTFSCVRRYLLSAYRIMFITCVTILHRKRTPTITFHCIIPVRAETCATARYFQKIEFSKTIKFVFYNTVRFRNATLPAGNNGKIYLLYRVCFALSLSCTMEWKKCIAIDIVYVSRLRTTCAKVGDSQRRNNACCKRVMQHHEFDNFKLRWEDTTVDKTIGIAESREDNIEDEGSAIE